jgi:hypothetical protein
VYDFRPAKTIADIGGGRGHLLRAVLDAAPASEGTLFDLREVLAGVDFIESRLTAQAGDFPVDALPGAELHVLHDWDDERCGAIPASERSSATASSLRVQAGTRWAL